MIVIINYGLGNLGSLLNMLINNLTFSNPNNFVETVATGQYFKFKLKLKTTTASENARILAGDISTNTLGCKVLMNRRTETSGLLNSTNGPSFSFVNDFFTGANATTGFSAGDPSVTINPRNLGTGEYYEVNNISGTGFNVTFYNSSGQPQGGKQFTYTASGFGKKV